MKIGLALSSGSLRGIAQIGVLKVLEDNNIKINYIAGSSVGALIASLYASGIPAKQLEAIALKTRIEELTDFTIPYEGLLKGDKIEKLVRKLTKNKTFSELKIPLSVVSTDITSGKKIIMNKGNIAKAVRASISVPAIFKPYRIKDKTLVDGGILDPLPVDVVRKMGADFIIAVDTTPSFKNIMNTDKLKARLVNDEFRIMKKNTKTYTKKILNSIRDTISKKIQNTKLPYPLLLTLDSIALMERQLAKQSAKRADIIIKPDLSKTGLFPQNLAEYYISQGEKAALKYTESFIKLRSFKKSK